MTMAFGLCRGNLPRENENHQQTGEKVELKRRISLYQAPAVIVGLIIGASIFITPGKVLEGTGSPGVAILIWSLAGVQATVGALCYIELGVTYPSSGEKYAYLEKMYSPAVAFCYMWMYLFMFRPGVQAIKCITFGKYILQLAFPDCNPPESAVKLLGVLLCVSVTYINVKDVEWSNRGHSLLAGMVALTLGSMIVIGFIAMGQGRSEGIWKDSFAGTTSNPGDIVLGMFSAIFAYNGWTALNFMMEEVKNPIRNAPIAVCLGLFIVMAIYLMINVCYMSMLGVDGMLKSDAVAVTYGQKLFPTVVWLVPVAVCIVQVTSFNGGLMIASRLCFVTARRGHLPIWLGLITTWSFSPVTALIIQAVLVILATTVFNVSFLIRNVIFLQTLFDLLTVSGMIYQRWKMPNLPRPFKAPWAVLVLFLLFEIAVVMIPLIYQTSHALLGVAAALGTALPVYLVFIYYRFRPSVIMRYSRKFAVLCQKIFTATPQESVITS